MATPRKNQVANPDKKVVCEKQAKPKPRNAPKRSSSGGGVLKLIVREAIKKGEEAEDKDEDEDYVPPSSPKKRKPAPKNKLPNFAFPPKTNSKASQVSSNVQTPTRSPKLTDKRLQDRRTWPLPTKLMDHFNQQRVSPDTESGLTEHQTKMLLDEGVVTPSDLALFENSFNTTEPDPRFSDFGYGLFPEDVPKSAPPVMQTGEVGFESFFGEDRETGSPACATPQLDPAGEGPMDTPYGPGIPTPTSVSVQPSNNNSYDSTQLSHPMSVFTFPGAEAAHEPEHPAPNSLSESLLAGQTDPLQEMRQLVHRLESMINAFEVKLHSGDADTRITAIDGRIRQLEIKYKEALQHIWTQFQSAMLQLSQRTANLEKNHQHLHQTTAAIIQHIKTVDHHMGVNQSGQPGQGLPSNMPNM